MKVVIINGSPRGQYSCTLQTILYIKEVFKEDDFEVLDISKKILMYERNMNPVIEKLKTSDLIIFSYPVYTFIAPSQLHRFIELLKEEKVDLSGKFVTQLTTSKHFYDITAHHYIAENCNDLKMKYIHGLSTDMEDLLKKDGQDDAINFFKYVKYCVENDIYEKIESVVEESVQYTQSIDPISKKEGKDVVIVADLKEDDTTLKALIDDYINASTYPVRIINIRNFKFSNGCIGCFKCATSGKCIYKDNFEDLLRNNIQNADAIIYAFTIKDHSMGVKFKVFDDRQFCNGHRTVTEGKPVGYIINGNVAHETNLRMIIDARSEVGHNFLAGVATDKHSIITTSKMIDYVLENHYLQPRNFLGVGGMKIFRDLIWIMRGIMKADHIYYKKHGVYDFPQKQRGKMIKICLLGKLLRNKKIQNKLVNKMDKAMLKPYQKVIDKAKE